MKNFRREIQQSIALLLVSLFSTVTLLGQAYYVYVTAESEDEVAVVKFDSQTGKAELAERITVGYMPTEIEGPHGITVSPDGKYGTFPWPTACPMGSSTNTKQKTTKL